MKNTIKHQLTKIHFFILIIFLFCKTTYSQNYDRPPIPVLSIEKSLNNRDYFRVIMLDNNFQLDTQLDTTSGEAEFWHILERKDYADSVEAKHFYGMADKDDPDYNDYPKWKEKFESISKKNLELANQMYHRTSEEIELPEAIWFHWLLIHSDWGRFKEISIGIRKDVLPQYKKTFESKIRATYTIKKVALIPAYKNEKKHYQISYFRKGSNVEVTMDDKDETWFIVEFITTKF